jgi:Zn-dependent M28 family amino/carboxypeptidase
LSELNPRSAIRNRKRPSAIRDPESLIRQLQEHTRILAGDIGERNVFRPGTLDAASSYIALVWRQQGYEVREQVYPVRGSRCTNLEVTRAGTDKPETFILVGAHYDSVKGSPGANDNGSGVAAMLEISRLFAEVCPRVSLRFVAFVNEEPPFFFWKQMGSMVYARAARKRQDNILCMASLETIGYYSSRPGSQRYPPFFRYFFPDTGDFIGFVANLKSRKVLRQAVQAFQDHSDFPLRHVATFSFIPGIFWSDHYSFWKHGYPAIMITDTAPYRYPWYHTAADTPDKVQYEPLARLTVGLFAMFAAMAGAG